MRESRHLESFFSSSSPSLTRPTAARDSSDSDSSVEQQLSVKILHVAFVINRRTKVENGGKTATDVVVLLIRYQLPNIPMSCVY